MPLAPGHLLVTTRKHHEKLSDVTEEEAAELGVWVRRMSRVLMKITGVEDWNVVQNNGLCPRFPETTRERSGSLELG